MDLLPSQSKIYLFLGGFLAVCLLVITAIMVDLWDGIYTAKKTGQKLHSHKLRVTIDKMSEYWRFIIIGFLVDCLGIVFDWYIMPFAAAVFGVGLIVVELKSMFEHAARRRSHVTDLPDIIKSIIECTKEHDARAIVDSLTKRP